jgi:hypothetical protein
LSLAHLIVMRNHVSTPEATTADDPSPTWVWKKAQDGVIRYVHKPPQ